jgi:hypothetical protein
MILFAREKTGALRAGISENDGILCQGLSLGK